MHDMLSGHETDALQAKFLPPEGGLRLQSGPGRDLIFKLTGEETGGLLDYFIVQVAPHGGPPLHVHHIQEETIHVLKGRFKLRCGDQTSILEPGGFAFLPARLPHAFLNLTDEPAEIIVVYVPGGGHKFYEELGPVSRAATPDRQAIANVFTKHDMTLLGGPLTAD
ncbi:MAG TPA: cupin domain-containing protein [Devosia sp.]|nr:cupin domain-containing protein [Devosia sp.]